MSESLKVEKLHQLTGHNASVFCVSEYMEEALFLSGAGDGWLVQWDFREPELGRLLAKVETQIFALKHLPGTSVVVVGNMNGGVHWVDLLHPDQTRNIAHHQKGVFAILHYADWVLTAGGGGMISRWDMHEKRAVDSLHLTNQSIRCLDYSPARNEIAVGASDHSIYLLDADDLTIRQHLPKAHDNSVFSIKYGPDGQHLYSGGRDAMLKIWDLHTSQCTQSIPAHWFTINDMVFSPDGQWLATASRDKTIKIWEAHSLKLVKVLDTIRDGGHVNSVNRLFWSPFENTLVSCSDDRSIILWRVNT